MMSNISLLDCTLRDGGYINDWEFGFLNIKSIIYKLVESKVDFVEVGFLRNCTFDKNRALFNNVEEIKKIIPNNTTKTKFTAMALHNLYDVNKLEAYDGTIEAIRVTFHDYDVNEGLEFCKEVIRKGYKCFCNPINIMGYSDSAILNLVQKVNEIRPYAFTIVDTFGSMTKTDLYRIYFLVENNLDKSIVCGLHLHENLSLSFSLAQDFIAICSANRSCVLDGSLMGMGRVPGNLCLELIMSYINRYFNETKYEVDFVLEAIDNYIIKLKEIEPWGYSTAYALSANYNLHRNYAEYLLKKDDLCTKEINYILSQIEDKKKTVFDQNYISELYCKLLKTVLETKSKEESA
jgi:4-hydroxy 2-oxovalerate aldolase